MTKPFHIASRSGRIRLTALFAFFLLPCFLLLQCDTGPIVSRGSLSEIIVCALTTHPDSSVGPLRRALEAPVRILGRPEKPFQVVVVPSSHLQAFLDRPLIVLIASERPATGEWNQPRQGLAPLAGLNTYRNVFAAGQFVLWLQAGFTDPNQFDKAAGIQRHLEALSVELRQERLIRSTAPHRNQSHESPFEIRLPTGFEAVQAKDRSASLEFSAASPSRTVTIFWRPRQSADTLADLDALLAWQERQLARNHGDRLLESEVAWRRLEHETQLRGVWQNPVQVVGGPLYTRFVVDEERNLVYGIQMLLFAPGHDKYAVLRELEAIAASFRPGVGP